MLTKFSNRSGPLLRWLATGLALLALTACGTTRGPEPLPSAAALGTSLQAATAGEYRVSRGDELNFRFFHTPELNTVATVRSDGKLMLPLLGEVQVEGFTMGELAQRVMAALSPQVKRPDVTINVQGTGAQRVFVGGEVARPGMQPLVGPMSVLQAVTVAEGLRDTAQPREVLVLRRGPKGERVVISVNLQAVLEGVDASQDVLLAPFDVVLVPRSGIANLNLWVDQYLRRNMPFSVGWNYSAGNTGVSR
jgi:polysaccharide biosynthesis/export protein